ncbi:AraC family transcriptional regulator [Burkholderia stagnalis]|uniref:AraC family transcriptional regulator n=1 Tax=Burkholderia stagnalis TaxID=1503054 RepID=A0A106P5T7_9BURK|nr:AraC family transcriptional regulator [Burkholderia stagnalis]KVL84418.1 AraC family transcriptional regulator [Burkholderia stagnalis]KVL98638.1 AraC family transcriptional regulator [Burkholderia stagnalis]KVM16929.1 AraC family transcriptional regulator [Burkholderia stagnalis]KVN08075.1 AraC family transcriptional regulator [Burkholderia stagnalis]KVN54717.1 AraC family transcriptional regulator [Burkholderia stagnalis]
MSDRLSNLISRFDLQARVFPDGGIGDAGGTDGAGHLHLLRAGRIVVTGGAIGRREFDGPSVLFLPRPHACRVDTGAREPADLVSASIAFGSRDENPLLRNLPDLLAAPLTCVPSLDAVQQLLFAEALEPACGHDAVTNRLVEVLMVQLLRYAMQRQLVDTGSLAGLSDQRLGKVLTAVHSDPSHGWTLEEMAGTAGMSRSRFAAHFADVVGVPPGEYLLQWRIGLAKALLRRGRPVKQIAAEVGYGSASALARAFAQGVGVTPTQWLAQQRG